MLVLLYVFVFFFVRSTISRQPDLRQSLHAGVLWFRMCSVPFWGLAGVMYNVLIGLAACGRLGVAAQPACLFGTRPVGDASRLVSRVSVVVGGGRV